PKRERTSTAGPPPARGPGPRRDASVSEQVLAAARTGPSRTELREFPMPEIPADSALMKMEVAGICGTDVKLYEHPPTAAPVIMGHENIGIITKAGREFTRRKGFKEGDLVFVEHYVMCGKCEWCHLGQYRHCENTNWRTNPDAIRYGYTSAEKAPHLWGGFSQYVYLPWNAVVHHVPKGVTAELAGLVPSPASLRSCWASRRLSASAAPLWCRASLPSSRTSPWKNSRSSSSPCTARAATATRRASSPWRSSLRSAFRWSW